MWSHKWSHFYDRTLAFFFQQNLRSGTSMTGLSRIYFSVECEDRTLAFFFSVDAVIFLWLIDPSMHRCSEEWFPSVIEWMWSKNDPTSMTELPGFFFSAEWEDRTLAIFFSCDGVFFFWLIGPSMHRCIFFRWMWEQLANYLWWSEEWFPSVIEWMWSKNDLTSMTELPRFFFQ